MIGKISDLIQRRNRERLYKQWMESDGLSLKDVPGDVLESKKERLSEQAIEDSDFSSEDLAGEGVHRIIRPQNLGGRVLLVPTRYVWLAIFIVVSLIVALSVVLTILVMRS